MNRFEITRQKAIILLLTAAALWSTSGLFIKLIDWKPLSILGGRTLIVFFVFLIYMRRLNLRLSPMKIAGAFSYVSVQLFFIIATKLTAAANAVFLHYTAPLYILLFGYWFLGERPNRADWVSMPLIFIGLILFRRRFPFRRARGKYFRCVERCFHGGDGAVHAPGKVT